MTQDRRQLDKHAPSPLDERARAVVERLQDHSGRQARTVVPSLIAKGARSRLRHGTWDFTQDAGQQAWLADKLVALDRHKAELCYLLCRAVGARRVVEAGTSYGASTIYLAAAVRDNLASRQPGTGQGVDEPSVGGNGTDGGVVFGTEHEPGKAAVARENLGEAGLASYAQVLEGDLRETLPGVPGPVDFMLVDIWIPVALPALQIVTPKLRPGALVVCDNVVTGRRQYVGYLDFVRDPAGPFTSVTVPGHGGLEISMKT